MTGTFGTKPVEWGLRTYGARPAGLGLPAALPRAPAPAVAPVPAPTPPAAPGSGATFDANKRSALASGMLSAGFVINMANRALSVGRLAAATPIAWKAHKMPLWTLEMALQKSTIDIVPYQGGRWNAWGKAYSASAGLKFAGALLTVGMAIPNTTSALREGGPAALVDTRPGRTGVISSLAGVTTLAYMGVAASHGTAGGALGMAKSMFTDPILGKWAFVGPMLGAYALIMANEFGYFDGCNRNDHRSTVQVFHDATASIPQNLGNLIPG